MSDLPRLLVLETSGRRGVVAVAVGPDVRGVRWLDETRRQARDLAPAMRDLLVEQGWKARDLHAVLVSRGPGSYTGLRVGLMTAKALAYATGAALLALDTFHAIAMQAPAGIDRVEVLADAQQEKVYAQAFARTGGEWRASGDLAIVPFTDWLARRDPRAAVTGPGLSRWRGALPPEASVLDEALWGARPEALLALGLARYQAGERDDPWTAEPLYLRPSSAEEQWDRRA